VPRPASFCGERETRSAGEGRLLIAQSCPSSAFGTFSPGKNAGEKGSRWEFPVLLLNFWSYAFAKRLISTFNINPIAIKNIIVDEPP